MTSHTEAYELPVPRSMKLGRSAAGCMGLLQGDDELKVSQAWALFTIQGEDQN